MPTNPSAAAYNNGGLTIREAFAMAAMQGFCAHPKLGDGDALDIADLALEQADALIDALNQSPGPQS